MARSKKKKRKSQGAMGWEAVAAATLATLGNTIGQLIADGAEHVVARRITGAGGGAGRANGSTMQPSDASAAQHDLMANVLRMLEHDGEKTIAEAVAAAGGAGLTRTLQALSLAREFKLIELDNEAGSVQLTDSGRRTLGALNGEAVIEREAEDPAEAMPE